MSPSSFYVIIIMSISNLTFSPLIFTVIPVSRRVFTMKSLPSHSFSRKRLVRSLMIFAYTLLIASGVCLIQTRDVQAAASYVSLAEKLPGDSAAVGGQGTHEYRDKR